MIYHGDCLTVMRTMDSNSVDAVVTDPPYFKVKGDAWDWQWNKPEQFLAWMGELCAEWERLLKPNGSLYVFASPRMAWGVEGEIRKRFNVLTNIRWRKEEGRHKASCKEELRAPFPASETIIFAEHYGADNIAKGEAGYEAKCDELRGFVFEPLRAYLDGERERVGLSRQDCDRACGNQMSGHYFSRVQWTLPTLPNYERLRNAAEAKGVGAFRREYEDLRREYEDLRRPFTVTADVPYTDVWDFPTVQAYKGKHPCEKPLALMRHMIASSTKPGAMVLDCFSGSASTGAACLELGRRFIGIDADARWVEKGRQRIESSGNVAAVVTPSVYRAPLLVLAEESAA